MDMKKSAKTTEIMAMSFMRMLRAGPEVSLSGSPTVSPTTAALWASEPLPWTTPSKTRSPRSTYFLALSQAPPVLDWEMASWTPETMPPARRPQTELTPKRMPKMMGESMTRAPGRIISRREASVEILMQAAWSGGAWPGVPWSRPGISRNWRATSLTISMAAVPTDFMVMAVNQYGSMAPMTREAKAIGSRMLTPLARGTSLASLAPLASLTAWVWTRVTKAPKRARDTRAAEPMAKPLPTAAVVLPAASRASVFWRTSAGRPDISAIPPALSQTGPYTSMARQVARLESMPRAARAMPYMPQSLKATKMSTARTVTGMMADL
mmetsp:Transcript_40021/g.73920  ORF Transcript_40021/g.73920 Transcript_40021/m.73920 type:complete len:324 (+) Transcript_40021:319-1290(+)